jgi:hypothetical protein
LEAALHDVDDAQPWWEVQITLRRVGAMIESTWHDMLLAFKRFDALERQRSNVASVDLGVAGAAHKGMIAVLVFAGLASLGDAIDEALDILSPRRASTAA